MRFVRQIFMLPRFVRVRVVSAFGLTAVTPILVAAYVVTQPSVSGAAVSWLCAVLLICIALVCLGLYLTKEVVFGVIDLARIAAEVFRNHHNRKVRSTEVVRLERLLEYMDDQLTTTRRLIRKYREEMTLQTRQFKLPPLVPATVLVRRLAEEIRAAEDGGSTMAAVVWKAVRVSPEETADDTYVPAWLQEALRSLAAPLAALGALRPGCWVGWCLDCDEAALRNALAAIPSVPGVSVGFWCLPGDGVSVEQILDFAGKGSEGK